VLLRRRGAYLSSAARALADILTAETEQRRRARAAVGAST
jgi:hypothetical protein